VTDRLLAALDGIQGLARRAGIRFQWPCWLLDWAWDRQATPYTPVKQARSEGGDAD
jgi:hypothetical protein